ncbi:unnamed protein product [Notodromas monacha]|uniref:Dynamin N-terminal domain-containing protein n=1 Tax=Notodromas monacha TaxID=399045 RepID=A0A7R9GB87_9CRUS|nr:unnamed protein product [Notodromas monacha]CAG0916245.1 unnamed protein product [Notodromas monacha]
MSSKVKQRKTANEATLETTGVNEKILRECHELYTDPQSGLVKIAEELGVQILAPRKKITVLLIGNHSAGKSSFINWYVEEHVQKVGVAIETQGFSFVTSGKKRESLTGNATLHLYPHFQSLSEIDGVVDYLNTEISTSKQKKFPLITFVDSPGLVDGDMKYPFDVNEAIIWLGGLADLIFVFFDPIGQALCKRTLNLVEALNKHHPDRIRFYLSKADDAGNETDRQRQVLNLFSHYTEISKGFFGTFFLRRVMIQIAQELCKRPGLNRQGFDMPTIYIPNPNKTVRCTNQIEDVCKDIEKTITQTVQNTLNMLEKDSEKLIGAMKEKLDRDVETRRRNRSNVFWKVAYYLMSLTFPMLMVLSLISHGGLQGVTEALVGREYVSVLQSALAPVKVAWNVIPRDYERTVFIVLVGLSIALFFLASWLHTVKPTLSTKRRNALMHMVSHVEKSVIPRKKELYDQYLRQCVADHDLI